MTHGAGELIFMIGAIWTVNHYFGKQIGDMIQKHREVRSSLFLIDSNQFEQSQPVCAPRCRTSWTSTTRSHCRSWERACRCSRSRRAPALSARRPSRCCTRRRRCAHVSISLERFVCSRVGLSLSAPVAVLLVRRLVGTSGAPARGRLSRSAPAGAPGGQEQARMHVAHTPLHFRHSLRYCASLRQL